jgi:cation/acetate symporter
LSALLAGGAFAAFLSTASGLTVSVAGVIDQDLLRRRLSAITGRDAVGVQGFRLAAVVAVVVPYVLSLATGGVGLADTVGLAFAVAASTFCPLLVLGVWWRGLSTVGATAGLVAGGALAMTAVLVTVFGGVRGGWAGALLSQPAAWTVPIAFTVTAIVSLATPSRVPRGTARTMVRLHTPEDLALDRSALSRDRSAQSAPPQGDPTTR